MKFLKILPHINFIFSLTMLVLIVVNSINPMMTFLRGDVFETALFILVAVGMVSSLGSMLLNARYMDEEK